MGKSLNAWISVLRVGRVAFDVHPGGARRWTIEAGFATVEVVGTRFELNRTHDALAVEVMKGVVLVASAWASADPTPRSVRLTIHDCYPPVLSAVDVFSAVALELKQAGAEQVVLRSSPHRSRPSPTLA